ncbi:hypothetical protein B0H14DRAFT_3094031 [Mycena olivaceomarginata]|nr:hypothetical protein B0H14DRAFT_3094031 [Mycena olivaceomarginata]
MRRAQSTIWGVVREGNKSNENGLRRQLIDKHRENSPRATLTRPEALQIQLTEWPLLETIQRVEKEYKSLGLLLDGTQRENDRCMSEIERGEAREEMLERELAKLAGENWQIEQQQATLAHIEQTREDKLIQSVEWAESEGRRFEELRSEIANSS